MKSLPGSFNVGPYAGARSGLRVRRPPRFLLWHVLAVPCLVALAHLVLSTAFPPPKDCLVCWDCGASRVTTHHRFLACAPLWASTRERESVWCRLFQERGWARCTQHEWKPCGIGEPFDDDWDPELSTFLRALADESPDEVRGLWRRAIFEAMNDSSVCVLRSLSTCEHTWRKSPDHCPDEWSNGRLSCPPFEAAAANFRKTGRIPDDFRKVFFAEDGTPLIGPCTLEKIRKAASNRPR